jgi:GTP-binding protein Era
VSEFKSGFVNIVGKPNAGKSTLMNQLVGEKLAIITPKAQTTRHRIMGIVTDEHFQFVFSDTPGILEPQYELHESMMEFVYNALDDADLLLVVIDATDKPENDVYLAEKIAKSPAKRLVILNKIDVSNQDAIVARMEHLKNIFPGAELVVTSALLGFNIEGLKQMIGDLLPIGPKYFPDDDLTDKTERFFASEIIREKIFMNLQKEVPYSTEVAILSFKEDERIIRIEAEIFCERNSQKNIIIGSGGSVLKKIGTEARLDMEKFWDKKIFLGLHVKVMEGWRTDRLKLKRLGYLAG